MKNVTKKHLLEAKNLSNKFGYWSDEVKNYIGQFAGYMQRLKIHNYIK